MSSSAYHMLRLGLAITFIWIGIMIVRDPVSWGAFLQPWVIELLPVPVNSLMLATGILDIVLGGLMLFSWWVGLASLIASIHLALILATSGVDAVTVRDIGLLGASLALMLEAFKRR